MLLRFLCFLTLTGLALCGLLTLLPTTAFAQLQEHLATPSTAPYQFATQRASQTMVDVETIVYTLGALCTIGCGIMCMAGRFSWKWFFAVIGGLVTVAGTAAGIGFLTDYNL